MNHPTDSDIATDSVPDTISEAEAFGTLTAKQAKYVRCWITGDYTKSAAYCEAYGKTKTDQNRQSIAASATRCHAGKNVQRAIAWMVSRENRKALMSRHEKRLFLAGVVRASTDLGQKLNPNDPLAKLDPLSAIKIDNDMSGDNAAQEVDVSLTSILKQLPKTSLVSGAVANVPVESAGGGHAQLESEPDGVAADQTKEDQRTSVPVVAGPFRTAADAESS